MPRLARAEQREETRRRLIESAATVFARVGFEAAAIDAITEEAGYSRGAFYSNFESKDDLFLLLITAHLDAEVTTLTKALSRIERAEDLAPAMERRYRVLGENSTWCLLTTEFQLYAMRGGKKAAEFAEINESYRRRLGALMSEHADRLGLQSSLSPYEFAVSLVALSHGLALQRLSNTEISTTLPARALGLFARGALTVDTPSEADEVS